MDDQPTAPASLDDLIAAGRAVFVSALGRGDAHAASAVYAADARLLPPSAALIRGRPQIAAFWQAGVDAGVAAVELDALELQLRGGLAYEIGRYTFRLRPTDGQTLIDHGHYVLLHERQSDGSWQRAVEMFTPDVSPTTARPDRWTATAEGGMK